MKKLWPLRIFHGPFTVGRDLLTCSTEYTLPVCFGCALASGSSAFAGVVSICFILFVRAIAASRREAKSQPSAAIAEELQMNEGRYLRRSTHPRRHGLRSIAEHRTEEIEVRGVGWGRRGLRH